MIAAAERTRLPRPSLAARIQGALLGLAAGDALGATVEFRTPAEIVRRYGRHSEIVGGGAFGWRPGQGTDDTDLAIALARAYAEGYSLPGAARHFSRWYATGPIDVGGQTRAALALIKTGTSPYDAGRITLRAARSRAGTAGNGSLMRALATGLVRADASRRDAEAREISAVTHADPRCIDACIAYCDIVSALIDGISAVDAVATAWARTDLVPDVREAIERGGTATSAEQLPTTGFVMHSLAAAVWAVMQDADLESTLVELVARGDDADTTAAIAGGLLGARDGGHAVPARWRRRLEYAPEIADLAETLATIRLTDDGATVPASAANSSAGGATFPRAGASRATRRGSARQGATDA